MEISDLFLSKSLIDKFNQCELSFNWRYVDKIKGLQAVESIQSALFGSLIHVVLEKYFKLNKEKNILEIYREEFKKSDISSHEMYEFGERLIQNYANDSDFGAKILGLEVPFQFYLSNGVPVKGIIDRINELSEDEIEIEDYKTGRTLPLTEKQLEHDLQLGMYNLAAKELFPKYKKVKLTLNYLHYGRVSCYRTEDQLDSLKNYLSVIYQKIVDFIKSGREAKPHVNSYCSFCDFKFKCPEFQKTIDGKHKEENAEEYKGLISPETGLVIDIDKMDTFLDALKNKIKILKKIEDQAKDFIKTYVQVNGKDAAKIKVGNTYYGLSQRRMTDYDANVVDKLIKDKITTGVDMNVVFEPKKESIDRLFKNDKESLEELKKTARVTYSEPFLR